MSHNNITVNQDEEKKHIRPYFKLKAKKYGMSDAETDSLIKYDEKTKKVSMDGMDIDYPYDNIDSKIYFNKKDLDSAWDEYIRISGKTLSDKQRYGENADYISNAYKNLNDEFNSDPFTSEYAQSIYKRYTDMGSKESKDALSDAMVYNQGSVDTTAIADAKKLQMDFKNQAYEKIADYSVKKADTGLKILESFGKENQKNFDNMQTDKTNTMKLAREKAEITGEIPDEIKDENPYINPVTGNVYNINMDYQKKIDTVKADIENTTDSDERSRLIKKYNNLVDARYAKIINNDEFKRFIDQGDITSEYLTLDNKKDIRDKNTELNKTYIQAEADKYESDKALEGEKYTADMNYLADKYVSDKNYEADVYKADKSLEGDKYVADQAFASDRYQSDKDAEAKKYASDIDLKEKALEGIMQHEELEHKDGKSKSNNKSSSSGSTSGSESSSNSNPGSVIGSVIGSATSSGTSGFGMPIKTSSYTVSSGFGPRDTGIKGASTYHKAVDLACDYGVSVVSSKEGVVTYSGWVEGYGNTVEIKHDNNMVTKYHHMAETPKVKVGDKVTKGQEIGKVGSTGISSGNHLDFQIFRNGVAVDPGNYLPFK